MTYVYIIQDACYPTVKVGISKKPKLRLRDLQATAAGQLTLRYLYKADCYMLADVIERIAKMALPPVGRMTQYFRRLSYMTEWYCVSPEQAVEEIDRAIGTEIPWKRCAISDRASRVKRANARWQKKLLRSQALQLKDSGFSISEIAHRLNIHYNIARALVAGSDATWRNRPAREAQSVGK